MKCNLILAAATVAAVLCSSQVHAEGIDAHQAHAIAADFLSSHKTSIKSTRSSLELSLSHTFYSSRDGVTPVYYVFADENHGGWVVVAADDRALPVLGYAEQGVFDMDKLPDNLRSWLDGYSAQLEYVQAQPDAAPAQSVPRKASSQPAIAQMLTTTWGQSSPFNAQCPKVGYYRTYTGCVATAMAQVMYYHRFPAAECRAIPAYRSSGGINVPELPATRFNWDDMLESYGGYYNTAQSDAVSTLMRYCGQSVEMNYSTSVSTSAVQAIPFALNYFFGYKDSATVLMRDTSNDADWDQMMYDELAQGRPIIYSGYDSNSGSHAFVIDGYRDGMFHVNWGWSGDYDSYWQLSALTPRSYNYSTRQYAVIGIEGDYTDVNHDGTISIADVTELIDMILTGQFDGLTGDANGDHQVNIADVTELIDRILYGAGFNANDEQFTVNGVSFTMVRVDGGTFTMGATAEQGDDADAVESPAHQVTLSTYYIGQTEVTQELWKAVMGTNPSSIHGPELPVGGVSWNDCMTFISRLNDLTGQTFRLPTEAEWEYAARGGNRSQGYKYAGSDDIDAVAWYFDNAQYSYGKRVALKAPNELGLYDMSGNMYEWCADYCALYEEGAQDNPQGPSSGDLRVVRSGSWYSPANECRNSARSGLEPDAAYVHIGLRLAK